MKKVHRVIRFIRKDSLKSYTDMNTKQREKAKDNFEKEFFKLMKIAVLGKTMANVRKYKDIKLVRTKRKRNYLVSEPNYHTTIFFSENLLAVEMKNKISNIDE